MCNVSDSRDKKKTTFIIGMELKLRCILDFASHYSKVIMRAMAPRITDASIVCSSVRSGTDQRKNQSSASLAFKSGIHRWPVNSPHKGPVTRKMFPFDDVIMICMLWTRLMLISDCYWLIQVSSPSTVALSKSVIPFLNSINITVRVFIWNIWSWEFCHSCFDITMFAFHHVEVQALVR